jgi:hypothetical protein
VAAIAAGAVTPTPLTRIGSELDGHSWRSDAHDMQQRSLYVNKIAQAFDETPSALVMESARQLEASLYSSACSYQSYSDESTWVSRLQQTIDVYAKHRAATGASTRIVTSTSAGRTSSSGASSNGAKPILMGVAAAVVVEAVAATEAATAAATAVLSPVGDATSCCTSATTSDAFEAADSTLACTTAVGSSAPASPAIVAESYAVDAGLPYGVAGVKAVLQQQAVPQQHQCAVKAEQIETDRTQTLSTAAVGSTSTAVMVSTAAAHKPTYSSTIHQEQSQNLRYSSDSTTGC